MTSDIASLDTRASFSSLLARIGGGEAPEVDLLLLAAPVTLFLVLTLFLYLLVTIAHHADYLRVEFGLVTRQVVLCNDLLEEAIVLLHSRDQLLGVIYVRPNLLRAQRLQALLRQLKALLGLLSFLSALREGSFGDSVLRQLPDASRLRLHEQHVVLQLRNDTALLLVESQGATRA